MLGIGWRYDDIWDTADQRCRITRVHGQLAFGQPKVLRSGDGAQFSQNRLRDTGSSWHGQLSKHRLTDVVHTPRCMTPLP